MESRQLPLEKLDLYSREDGGHPFCLPDDITGHLISFLRVDYVLRFVRTVTLAFGTRMPTFSASLLFLFLQAASSL